MNASEEFFCVRIKRRLQANLFSVGRGIHAKQVVRNTISEEEWQPGDPEDYAVRSLRT